MTLARMLNVSTSGPHDGPPLVFLHGYGCGQQMWRFVAPHFASDHQVVLFDLPGSGGADPASYDVVRHDSLEGYRDDVIAVLRELRLEGVTLVGHSVAAMIGVLVQTAAPELVDRLVLVAPSARYLDDDGYEGGFSEADITDLLNLMEHNHLGWQDSFSTMVAGGAGPATKTELEDSFCRTRPQFASQFARVTFRGDNRADLERVTAPTLVLRSRHDAIAPATTAAYVHEHIRGSVLEVLETRGHCPHLSAPEVTTWAIRRFLETADHR